ncbi:hypothetical protein [Mangrovibacterium lignilyticum]|uniref:hypothetical protein n=1 Tax=Mangrovibacterium lignilyticum TaxID=2668052 RepID=UPI0013D11D82|nr:hypothetical protein [Mangrovibacterium lignilyticum]
MKKPSSFRLIAPLFLAGLLFLLFTGNVQAQWYKKYGVTEMNELTEVQLSHALHKAKRNTWIGAAITGIGTALIIEGIIDVSKSNKDNNLFEEFANAIGGTTEIVLGVVPFLAVGVPLMVANANRKKNIELALVRLGTTACFGNNPSVKWGSNQSSTLGLSLKINF